jgi:Uma2 family endonuclease
MANTTTTFPLTRLELVALADGDALLRWPATEEEYWDLLAEAEYKADFYQHEIIAMSYETDFHSHFTTRILYCLTGIFIDQPGFRVHNPNRPICVRDCDNAIFNPDASVVTQPPIYYEYRPGMNAETTPIILVEVLSKNTRDYDVSDKLPCYKKIPTLRQIIYVDSARPYVTVYERTDDGRQWLNTDYERADEALSIHGTAVTLQQIYQDVFF